METIAKVLEHTVMVDSGETGIAPSGEWKFLRFLYFGAWSLLAFGFNYSTDLWLKIQTYIQAAAGESMLCTDQIMTLPASKADEQY